MKKFVYVGPPSSITLGKKYEDPEVILGTNAEVELPEEHPHVVRLVARRLLITPELAVVADLPSPKDKGSSKKRTKPSATPENSTPSSSTSE